MFNTDQERITIKSTIAQLEKEGIVLDEQEAQSVLQLMDLLADIFLSESIAL